jgi:hypothetical protein
MTSENRNYHDISLSIADTVSQVTKPLTDVQRSVIATAMSVWCEKLIADALSTLQSGAEGKDGDHG